MSRVFTEEQKSRHKIAVKKWQQKNYLKRVGYKKKYEVANPEKVKEANRRRNEKYRINNREKIRIFNQNYRDKDRVEFNKKARLYEKSRKGDIRYVLLKRLRMRLADAVRGKFKDKAGSAVKLLGCSIEELKFYLEGQFKDGMSWETYGRFGWHIDLI
jgi:hypothetical protein